MRIAADGRVKDVRRDGIESRGAGVDGDDIVVERERDGEHEARDDARDDLRQDDFKERLRGRCAQIERRLVEGIVHLLQFGHDGEDDEGGADDHVSHEQRKVRFGHPERDEKNGERERRDDLRIDDGDAGNRTHGGFYAFFAVIHPDGAQRSQHGGERRRGEREPHGVADHRHHLFVAEEVFVVVEGESSARSDDVGVDKTVHGEQQDGGIEQQEHKSYERRLHAAQSDGFLVHRFAPLTVSSSLNPPVSQVERNTTMSRMSATIEPMCQLVPKYS